MGCSCLLQSKESSKLFWLYEEPVLDFSDSESWFNCTYVAFIILIFIQIIIRGRPQASSPQKFLREHLHFGKKEPRPKVGLKDLERGSSSPRMMILNTPPGQTNQSRRLLTDETEQNYESEISRDTWKHVYSISQLPAIHWFGHQGEWRGWSMSEWLLLEDEGWSCCIWAMLTV